LPIRSFTGALLEERHLLGGEDRVEQLAEVLVVRRVDLEGDERPDLPDLHRVDARAEDLGVLEHVAHLGVAADDDHPDVGHVHDRPCVPKHLEEGLRVGETFEVHLPGCPCHHVRHRSPPVLIGPL
jgi:hypothetical protein